MAFLRITMRKCHFLSRRADVKMSVVQVRKLQSCKEETEYEYVIDAVSGAILEYDIDED